MTHARGRTPAPEAWPTAVALLTLESRRQVAGAEAKLMNPSLLVVCRSAHCELRFQSLFDAGRAYVFPCDVAGKVDLDSLSDRARKNYLCARTLIGREFSYPTVVTGAGR
jgi:hypothetical protein